jgi:hypothetical protein
MIRKFITTTLIVAFVLMSASIGAAATGTQQITALLNYAIKITLNGESWTPRDAEGNPLTPITYEGSTYLPVRAVAEAAGIKVGWDGDTQTVILGDQYDAVLEFPADVYPQTGAHIAAAIMAGESAICTIDRKGAEQRRQASLAGIPTLEGYDRDEWPMAMCAEGGKGAHIAYVESSDNRGAGAFVGNALEQYQDGARVKFVITFGELNEKKEEKTRSAATGDGEVHYASCSEVRAAGAAPLRKGDPGYSTRLDRDGDGIACEI